MTCQKGRISVAFGYFITEMSAPENKKKFTVWPNLYASRSHPYMNQTLFFECIGKFKCWLHFWLHFWVHICVKSWRKEYDNSVLYFWFMSWYESFKILTGCPSRNSQQEISIFPLDTKSHFCYTIFWPAKKHVMIWPGAIEF